MNAAAGDTAFHVDVFLVDDNMLFLDSATHLLARQSGIAVVGRARSAEEALPRVAQLQPDVVLLDLAMPGIGGLECTRRLKEGPTAPHVIIVTLHDLPEYRQAARTAGADAFVAKRDLLAVLMPMLAEMFPPMATSRNAPASRGRPAPIGVPLGVSKTSARASQGDLPTILVIENEAPDRTRLERALTEAGHAVEAVASGTEAIARARGRAFDAIILDLLLPDLAAYDVMAGIRAEGPNRDTPVVVVTVLNGGQAAACFAVRDFLTKPVRPEDLLTSLERAGVTPDPARAILVVEDDPSTLHLAEAALAGCGYRVVAAATGAAGLQAAEAESPAAVVLDLMMPEMDGFEFLAHFRSTRQGRWTPVIVWTAKDLTAEERLRLNGAAARVVANGNGAAAASLLAALDTVLRHA